MWSDSLCLLHVWSLLKSRKGSDVLFHSSLKKSWCLTWNFRLFLMSQEEFLLDESEAPVRIYWCWKTIGFRGACSTFKDWILFQQGSVCNKKRIHPHKTIPWFFCRGEKHRIEIKTNMEFYLDGSEALVKVGAEKLLFSEVLIEYFK